MSNEYRFTTMFDDSNDYAEFVQCFEDDEGEGWSVPEYKIECAESLRDFVAKYGIDISDMVSAFCDDVRSCNDPDEVGLFDMTEDMLNAKGVYTYNSDTWFEVYGKTVPVTPKQLEEQE
jgi:hypothetical protein